MIHEVSLELRPVSLQCEMLSRSDVGPALDDMPALGARVIEDSRRLRLGVAARRRAVRLSVDTPGRKGRWHR